MNSETELTVRAYQGERQGNANADSRIPSKFTLPVPQSNVVQQRGIYGEKPFNGVGLVFELVRGRDAALDKETDAKRTQFGTNNPAMNRRRNNHAIPTASELL